MNAAELGPRYQVLRPLGAGGMGEVFLVRDSHLDRELALKLFHRPPATQEAFADARREFSLLASIDHPGIARAHDFGRAGERPYFTREYVAGRSLEALDLAGDGPALLVLLRELAAAVAFLHRHEILHLDIKPANVIVPRVAGELSRPVLIDFGLCRRGSAAAPGRELRGTLPYMAPEYFRDGPLGPWTDVYAFGVLLYRLATGRLPRAGAAAVDGDQQAAGEPWLPVPRPPSRLRSGLPRDLDRVALRCLALDPGARFASGMELHAALHGLAPATTPREEARAASPLTAGRENELESATGFLRDWQSSAGPPVLLVTSPAGMGQSHFLRAVKARAQGLGFPAYLEVGYPGRPGSPGSLLRSLAHHVDAAGRRRWLAFLGRLSRPRPPAVNESSEAERRLRRAGEAALAAAALHERLVLVVDGLQSFDEVSIALVLDLLRTSLRLQPLRRPPLGMVLAYREEGPARDLLVELTACILAARAPMLALRPLDIEETLRLHAARGEAAGGGPGPAPSPVTLWHQTAGTPARIVAPGRGAPQPAVGAPRGAPRGGAPRPPPGDARELLLVLSLLARPAAARELSRILAWPPRRVRQVLDRCRADGLASAVEETGKACWSVEPAGKRDPAGSEERTWRLRIARALCREANPGEQNLVEAARHFALAGARSALRRHGLRAARYLKATFQNRAARELLEAVRGALPRGSATLEVEVALELAELHSRGGDLDQGIRILRDLLARGRQVGRGARLRLLLALGALHARRGDFRRADSLFREGLGERGEPPPGLGEAEHLAFLNEQAAVKSFLGEPEEALHLSAAGLRRAARRRGARFRELALNLHATRAHVALRAFDYPAAARRFERALEIAEAIGSATNQAVILNNLGILHSQCDRFVEAERAWREAERLCVRLDEGPSLTSIHGNLAVLHAKRGDFAAMEEALARGERLLAGEAGRQEFFLKHCRGIALLHRGRFAAAQAALEAAIRLGEAMGDRHLAGYDALFRGEALLFQGRYREARTALEALAAASAGAIQQGMALARLALIEAFCGRGEFAVEAARRHAALAAGSTPPFIAAWDRLHLGWACSLALRHEEARDHLVRAREYFIERGLKPAASLALWVEAEACLLAGRLDEARARVLASPDGGGEFTGVLWPLLAARLELAAPDGAPEKAAGLLASAGAALVGNPLAEWNLRTDVLLARLSGEPEAALAEAAREREDLAREVPAESRGAYRRSEHWQLWAMVGTPPGAARPPPAVADPAARSPAGSGKTTTVRGRAGEPAGRERLVARSAGMRRLLSVLDRLRRSELPVLIQGETGSGKELIARTIHAESRRHTGPFRVLEASAIPLALIEAELFGARAGAFTGSDADRDGLLAAAAGGTVLIDEVGDLPLEAQGKLLRVLAEGKFRPLGAQEEVQAGVRFLFATTRDLESEARSGRFRADLLHRVRVVTIEVPPLRERPEDFDELAAALAREAAKAAGLERPPRLDAEALARLRARAWPGNARELKNLLARLALESSGTIDAERIRRALDAGETTVFPRNLLAQGDLPALHRQLERDYVLHHFGRLGGDSAATARFLRLGLRQFYRRCERLGISLRAERSRIAAAGGRAAPG